MMFNPMIDPDNCVNCARPIGEHEARQLQLKEVPDEYIVHSCIDSYYDVVTCCMDCRDSDDDVFANANEAAGLIARKGFDALFKWVAHDDHV